MFDYVTRPPRSLGILACSLAIVLTVTTAATSAEASTAPMQPTASQRTAAQLSSTAGFTPRGDAKLTKTSAVSAVPLTPFLVADLATAPGPAYADGPAIIDPPSADGSVIVVEPGAFGIVTNRHAVVEYSYKVSEAPGTTLINSTGGALDQINAAGRVVGHIDPAHAVDSTGAKMAASYSYDTATHELIVKADTTTAQGAVFIDPSWKCWAVASAIGLAAIVVAAGWLFTDGTESWVIWALKTWFRVSPNAANIIAKACV